MDCGHRTRLVSGLPPSGIEWCDICQEYRGVIISIEENGYTQLNVWLPRGLVEAFKQECETTGQPIRQVMGEMLYAWLEERA
jgi:hypothetical protein